MDNGPVRRLVFIGLPGMGDVYGTADVMHVTFADPMARVLPEALNGAAINEVLFIVGDDGSEPAEAAVRNLLRVSAVVAVIDIVGLNRFEGVRVFPVDVEPDALAVAVGVADTAGGNVADAPSPVHPAPEPVVAPTVSSEPAPAPWDTEPVETTPSPAAAPAPWEPAPAPAAPEPQFAPEPAPDFTPTYVDPAATGPDRPVESAIVGDPGSGTVNVPEPAPWETSTASQPAADPAPWEQPAAGGVDGPAPWETGPQPAADTPAPAPTPTGPIAPQPTFAPEPEQPPVTPGVHEPAPTPDVASAPWDSGPSPQPQAPASASAQWDTGVPAPVPTPERLPSISAELPGDAGYAPEPDSYYPAEATQSAPEPVAEPVYEPEPEVEAPAADTWAEPAQTVPVEQGYMNDPAPHVNGPRPAPAPAHAPEPAAYEPPPWAQPSPIPEPVITPTNPPAGPAMPEPAAPPWGVEAQPAQPSPAAPPWASQPAPVDVPDEATPGWAQPVEHAGGAPWEATPVTPVIGPMAAPAQPDPNTTGTGPTLRPVGPDERVPARPTPSRGEVSGPGKTLAVLSGKGGVGKSQTTVWVAQAVGQALQSMGRSVGVIDANIGQGDVSKLLGMFRNTPDLAHLAHGRPVSEQELDRVIQRVDWLNADCLFAPAEPMTVTTDAALVALSSTLRLMRRRHSWTIIDSPVATSHDAIIRDFVAREADLILMLVAPDGPTLDDAEVLLTELCAPTIEGGMAFDPDRVAIVLNRSDAAKTGISLNDVEERFASWRTLGEIPEIDSVRLERNKGNNEVPREAAGILAEIVSTVTDVHVAAPKFRKAKIRPAKTGFLDSLKEKSGLLDALTSRFGGKSKPEEDDGDDDW